MLNLTSAITPKIDSKAVTSPHKLINRRATSRKKTWGIFYTPDALITTLTKWAIRAKEDSILEPSFGGCGFLDACAGRLTSLEALHPWRQMCGCDIDQRAFIHLPSRFQISTGNKRFLLKNFLSTEPMHYSIRKFSVVIGNPPYVSRHNMRRYQLKTARRIVREANIPFTSKASLWAYFVLHSLQFLMPHGRMAWVLPRALSQGQYGQRLLRYLCGQFQKVSVIAIHTRIFVSEGTEEFVDVLLCENFTPDADDQAILNIQYSKKIPKKVSCLANTSKYTQPLSILSSARTSALSKSEIEVFKKHHSIFNAVKLGIYANARIGIVTGATSLFVLKKSQLHENGLTRSGCSLLLTKFRLLKGVEVTRSDAKVMVESDQRVLLVRHDVEENIRYWKRMPLAERLTIKTFQKRLIWNAPDDCNIPHAFFPPLVDKFPRIVINNAQINSSNTVHRVYFRPEITKQHQCAIALSFLTSFVQLSCELQGRQCGSGGLKFEPSDFGNIEVPLFNAEHLKTSARVLQKVDELLRDGKIDQAVSKANQWLSSGYQTKLQKKMLQIEMEAIQRLRKIRGRT